MPKFEFTGVAFVSAVKIIVEGDTLAEAIGRMARKEYLDAVNVNSGTIEYAWADLNSGREIKK